MHGLGKSFWRSGCGVAPAAPEAARGAAAPVCRRYGVSRLRNATIVILLGLLAPAGLVADRPLRLEEILAEPGLAGPSPTQLQWSPDGRLVSFILPRDDGKQRDLWAIDAAAGTRRLLVSHERLERLAPPAETATSDERERERRLRYAVASYLWSPDSQSILFTSAGRLYLYDLGAEKARPLAPGKEGVRDAKFSPNGRWVSFVYQHDLWLAPASGGEERQLTTGATEDLLHGDLDWVYPEELGVRTGYHWSPDGRRLAFLEIDQSTVARYPIADLAGNQPDVDWQRYPKAGGLNPRVRVGIIEASSAGRDRPPIVWVDHDAEYVPRVDWLNDDWLAAQYLNREQTELELVFADAQTGRAQKVLVERDPHWVNISNDLTFLDESREFLWTSERSGFRHIYLYDYDGQVKRALTKGDWEIKSVAGFDKERGWVYYTSNERNALGADLYRVKLDGGGKQRLTQRKGTHLIEMNQAASAYADSFSGLTTTPQWDVRDLLGQRTTLLRQSRTLEEYGLVEPELIELRAADQALIRGLLLKPRELEEGRRYPVVVYVYGGPRAPTIRDSWGGGRERYLFHQYLVQQGYLVFYVDDRASSILGHRHEVALYRDYGPAALQDQLEAVEHLKSLQFVDPDRIAIWGWSAGGFSTCLALTHSDVFKVGIAVAPVTDWSLYDTIYTERYMGRPEKEPEAYRRTSCLAAAEGLSGKLLLAHGTADDNVHFQNTVRLVEALVEGGKPYDLLIYPGKTHGIYGEKARLHLFRAIEAYLKKNL